MSDSQSDFSDFHSDIQRETRVHGNDYDDGEESYYSDNDVVLMQDSYETDRSSSNTDSGFSSENESESDTIARPILDLTRLVADVLTGGNFQMAAPSRPRNIISQRGVISESAEEELAKKISETEVKLVEDIVVTMTDPMSIRRILLELPGVNPDDPRFESFMSGMM